MTSKVTVLGTGIMGAGMARSLLRAGHEVTVWNRDPAKASPLAEAGAVVAADPATAVRGADVVLTMLFDADAVRQVMAEALPALTGVWVQAGTVGVEAAENFAGLGVRYVDAPVFGTRKPAEDGALVVLAAGPEDLREAVAPVFDAIGARTVWVSERPGDGHRLKLTANAWVLSITAATAQSVRLAEDLGLDPRLFLDVLSGGPLDSPYAQLKGGAMINGEYPPAFPAEGAAKDAGLILAAMRGTDDRLMRALKALFDDAVSSGAGAEDMAAVKRVFHR